MKKIYLGFLILLFIVWPQHKSAAKNENNTTVGVLLRYQLVKSEVLNYQINKRIENVENRMDSVKLIFK